MNSMLLHHLFAGVYTSYMKCMLYYFPLQYLNYLVLTMRNSMANHIGLLMELQRLIRLVQ